MIDEAVRCTPRVSASDISEHFVIVRQYMGQIIFNKGHRVSALFRPEWRGAGWLNARIHSTL